MNTRFFPLAAGIVALILVLAVIVVSLTSSAPARQQTRTQEDTTSSSSQGVAPLQQPADTVEQTVTLPPTVETTVDIN